MKQARPNLSKRPVDRSRKAIGRPVVNPGPIAKLLEESYLSVSDIAKAIGVSSQAVSMAISGRTRSARIVGAIAQATGKSVAEIDTMIIRAARARLAKQPS